MSLGNSKVAYQGVLYYNFDTSKKIYRSVFFPATGRLNNKSGNLESAGSTGYYWSSSVGPGYNRSELISGTMIEECVMEPGHLNLPIMLIT